MRADFLTAMVLLIASLSGAASAAPSASSNSLIGTWTFKIPGTDCSETYTFRADGTSFATSGEERAESSYQVSAEPSAKGFYKLVGTIVKDNGKKDCSGGTTELGHRTTNYIRFDPSGEELTVCQTESLDACFGPVKRVRAKGS